MNTIKYTYIVRKSDVKNELFGFFINLFADENDMLQGKWTLQYIRMCYFSWHLKN
jgi:hypothetical protein